VLAPLGDRHDRRTIIFIKGLLLVAALLLCGFSGGLSACPVITVPTVLPRLRSGASAADAGTISCATVAVRPVKYFGWRTMYMVAALAVLLISLTLWRVLPRFTPGTSVKTLTEH
jgi:predicted MFS family arabinose efflux permease